MGLRDSGIILNGWISRADQSRAGQRHYSVIMLTVGDNADSK